MELIKKFISTINTAVSNCSLYSEEHEHMDESADRVLSVINEIAGEKLEVMIIGNDLIVNRLPIGDAGTHGGNFIKRLKRKGVTRVEFLKGVTGPEIRTFIADISDSGNQIKTYPHIRTGVTGVRISGGDADVDFEIDGLADLHAEQSDKIKDLYSEISHFRRLESGGLEDVVVNFILTFRKEANILKLLSPVKSYSEYTYTHATNVSVLSMFQAEMLGIKGKLLHDVGIAALLHDVGKLFVPNEILNKKGALDDSEFRHMTRHTILGAKYLLQVQGITGLAPIVAYEHHLKYDGSGYPGATGNGRKQHICSQIVAISDFFDALRSWRPYRKSWDVKEIIAIMQKNSGKDFNTFLLDNFVTILHKALSA